MSWSIWAKPGHCTTSTLALFQLKWRLHPVGRCICTCLVTRSRCFPLLQQVTSAAAAVIGVLANPSSHSSWPAPAGRLQFATDTSCPGTAAVSQRVDNSDNYPVSHPNAVQRSDTWMLEGDSISHLALLSLRRSLSLRFVYVLHETRSTPHGLLAEVSLLSCPTSGRLDLSSLEEAMYRKKSASASWNPSLWPSTM